jgi:hypothetical protein
VDGAEDGVIGAAPEIGAADGAGEKRVAGEENLLLRQVETRAAGRVAGRVEDLGAEACAPADFIAGLHRSVHRHCGRREKAEGGALHGDIFEQPAVFGVHQNGRAGSGLEFGGAADVVRMSVRDEDGFDLEVVAVERGQMASGSSPGSMTMASRVSGSPTTWQLHCRKPTGRTSWMRFADTSRLYSI